MSFYCCNHFLNVRSFFVVAQQNYESLKIEYSRCPHCKKSFYKEIKTDFNGNRYNTNTKMGKEAEFLIEKAFLNRLDFFTPKGTKTNQEWYYGDFKKTNQKDEKGNLLELQIKRNFNGEEVANLGIAKITYI